MSKKIQILLSTYNGEKYLRQQLDSIIGQRDVDFNLLIRDDGSSDRTLKILKNYARKDKRITFYEGKNIGASASFFELISKAGDADYYSFCDQDDVWDDDKLISAIEAIEKKAPGHPILYYSNLKIVDEDLHYYRMAHATPHIQDNKYCAVVGNMAHGCTMVLNQEAMELIKRRTPKACEMHDWWVFLVLSFFGELIYDFDGHISYRQHRDNLAGAYLDKITWKFVLRRIHTLMNPEGEPRYTLARNLLNCYGDIMSREDYLKIKEFVDYKKSIKSNFRLLTDRDFHGTNKKRDVLYRFCVLMRIA